jgi:hypothetical protein
MFRSSWHLSLPATFHSYGVRLVGSHLTINIPLLRSSNLGYFAAHVSRLRVLRVLR